MTVREIQAALAAPFDPSEVFWKPQTVSKAGNQALAAAYIDARVVMDRLDEVMGIDGWHDEYTPLPEGGAICRLSLRINGEWITKEDVGGESKQPDEGDREKSAFSNSLKRAAVKWGIGRYLYRLPKQWCDYDPQKKKFISTPRLPAWALPTATDVQPSEPAPKASTPARSHLPASGAELQKRLYDYDKKLAEQGVIAAGELVKQVVAEGVKRGYDPDLTTWDAAAIGFAVEETKRFEAEQRAKPPGQQESTPSAPSAPKITADQKITLWKLMLQHGVAPSALERIYGITSLNDVPLERFQELESAIQTDGSPLAPHSGLTFAEFLQWYDGYISTTTQKKVAIAKGGELSNLIKTLAADKCHERRHLKDWDASTVKVALECVQKFVFAAEQQAKSANTVRT